MKQNNKSVKIIPLGGLEQIGMNITAFEYEDSIIVVGDLVGAGLDHDHLLAGGDHGDVQIRDLALFAGEIGRAHV